MLSRSPGGGGGGEVRSGNNRKVPGFGPVSWGFVAWGVEEADDSKELGTRGRTELDGLRKNCLLYIFCTRF